MSKPTSVFNAKYLVFLAGNIAGFKKTKSGAKIMARRLAVENPNRTIVVAHVTSKYDANVDERTVVS